MSSPARTLPDVYTPGEVVRAAGLHPRSLDRFLALIWAGDIRTIEGTGFLSHREALRAAALIRSEAVGASSTRLAGMSDASSRVLFAAASASVPRRPAVPLLVSSVLHSAVLTGLVVFTALGIGASVSAVEPDPPQKVNLVYLNLPGPGGGGGGGGLRQKAAPPKAERKGTFRVSSPMPVRTPPPVVVAVEKPPEPPPPLKAEPLPPVIAPVVRAPVDVRDRVGVLSDATNAPESRGPGTGGGVGSGHGTGVGEGDGAGIGPGSGGGMGGGPYRPGSGIEPPRLVREIKPDYTDEARRRNLEGEVGLEIVIRRDGSVSDVRVIKGLGAGLDQRAVDAVRQWRFAPARRLGSPVDVVVEVAVEFRLR
ncbi:MAG: energy transducer TonB [Acidobacteria bacterium]|nr:energy transducer TonB [Acidobacteriota bacterium]